MIRQLTKEEFIDIATNGIKINLYDNHKEDYIQSLIQFIDSALHGYYISDFDASWCEIAKDGINSIKVSFEEGKVKFYLADTDMSVSSDKKSAGIAIKIVYMHSVAWDAIHNEGKINQQITPWPV